MINNVYIKDCQLFANSNLSFISPYMDLGLMKHCVLMSEEEKINKLQNKEYLKDTLSPILPKTIINKQKHKFHVPIAEWLKTDLYEKAYETLSSKNGLINSYMNQKMIMQRLEDHRLGKADYNRQLWGILFLENWYKMKKQYL